ncbi:MAG: AMP-binding protein [Psychromonas sp.]|nr:AMP-binding protein [Psychromonas sp.]
MEKLLMCCPVRYHAQKTPHNIAIQNEDYLLSFATIDKQIDALSMQLLKIGMKVSDRLICISPNCVELVLLQLSCLRTGIIFSPLNPQSSKDELTARIATLDSQFVYIKETQSEIHETQAQIHASLISLDFSSGVKLEKTLTKPFNNKQVISIIFTSGSRGDPKAVMHNYHNHYYSAMGSMQVIPIAKNDKNLLSLPLFHISGYATVMRTMIAGAMLVVTSEKLSSQMLKKNEITHLSLVSAQLYTLLNDAHFVQNKLSLKHLLLGGSAFSSVQVAQTKRLGFTYHLSYGLTEMASQVATSTNNDILQLLPYQEVKIHHGELLIRGETSFVGYLNDKNRCKTTWFASNDFGEFFQNKNNLLIVTGRKDRLFISGGENIHPEDIEKVLLGFSEIRQAYVLGIKDQKYGDRPVAFLDCALSTELHRKIKEKLTYFKRPVRYFILPKQSSLKVSLQTLLTYLQEKNVYPSGVARWNTKLVHYKKEL